MSAFNRQLRALAAVAMTLSLGACISLFPKDDPAQLYRFDGREPSSEASVGRPATQFGVVRAGGAFSRAASGDRILTVTGGQAAYVAASRWVSPASTLFDEALARAFDLNTGAARLVTRGEAAKADFSLRVDVTRFEAVYDRGPEAAPLIMVSLRVTLARPDRTLAGSDLIEAQVRAGDNRVSAIVAAFDQAVGDVLSALTAWTNRTGSAA
ncbi:ABC-type transport auxiliary lipoprotein family protein [Phenylobacterium sp.]|uniref:ABC-type transport auxiliary lipoprotein family protein n=1 Tax=Phenylobacterium sp. TaxID=1871053 RepID=UPI00286CB864|nr:ABC-type transport auxiliary lipoprotein family protein [Phenylobacterium sp.]